MPGDISARYRKGRRSDSVLDLVNKPSETACHDKGNDFHENVTHRCFPGKNVKTIKPCLGVRNDY